MSGQAEQQAYLSIGGNLGDPRRAMTAALQMLDADLSTRVIAVSSIWRTPPWGDVNQPHFLNAAAEVRTTLSARGLLTLCLSIETRLKRIRTAKGGPRSIDVDVLTYGNGTYREIDMEIPHPRMLERAFVIVPLLEIAPDVTVGGRPVADFLPQVDQTGFERLVEGGEWWRDALG